MDDSLEAFKLPETSQKSFRSLAIRRKGETICEQARQSEKMIISFPNTSNSNDVVDSTCNAPNDSENDQSFERIEPKTKLTENCIENTEATSPASGFCTICKSNIPKDQCSQHYSQCLSKKFSSKYSTKLSDVIVCSTCGKDVEIIKYPTHVETCENFNLEIAKKLSSQDAVTSSYFQKNHSEEPVEGNSVCPSCGKDVSLLSTPLKTRHVNMCLDSMEQDNSSSSSIPTLRSRTSAANICKLCTKSFKTSRGLKLHERSCNGNTTEANPKRKRKVRPPRDAEEELLQLAKGISASTRSVEEVMKKEEKRRKRDVPVPIMLQVTEASRKNDLEAKLNKLVPGFHPHDDVSSTPPLPKGKRWGAEATSLNASNPTCGEDIFSVNCSLKDSKTNVNDDQLLDAHIQRDQEMMEGSGGDETKPSEVVSIKWKLGTKQTNTQSRYRVAGLLTQFEDTNAMEEEETNPIKEDTLSSLTKEGKSVDDETPIDSTLYCLVNLHKGGESPSTGGRTTSQDCDDSRASPVKLLREVDLIPEVDHLPEVDFLPEVDLELDQRESEKKEMTSQRNSLNHDMSLLLDQSKYSDLKLHFHNGTVQAHKCILSVRCPHLLQMFLDGCDAEGNVHIDRCDIDEFKVLLRFIYTDQCEDYKKVEIIYEKLGVDRNRNRRSPDVGVDRNRNRRSPDVGVDWNRNRRSPDVGVDRNRNRRSPDVGVDRNRKRRSPDVDGFLSSLKPDELQSNEPISVASCDSPVSIASDDSVQYVMSDSDLFSSFTGKPHVHPGDSPEQSTTETSDVFTRVHTSDLSDDDLIAFNLSRFEGSKRISSSQPATSGARVQREDQLLSQPPSVHDSGTLSPSMTDSSLLTSAMRFDELAHQESGIGFKTPMEGRKRRCPLVPITPMPNFSDMETPDIINRGRKIGLKKSLGKKKLKIKLKELHAYTHQVESSGDEEQDEHPPPDSPIASCKDNMRKTASSADTDSDGDIIFFPPPDQNRKKEQEEATRMLEGLPDEEFERSFKDSLSLLHRKGILLEALKREEASMKGVPIGSKRDLGIWMQRLTPDNPYFRKEWPIMLNLPESKQQILVRMLSMFMVQTPDYSSYQPFLFSILPVIYRAVIRMNKSLRCLVNSDVTAEATSK